MDDLITMMNGVSTKSPEEEWKYLVETIETFDRNVEDDKVNHKFLNEIYDLIRKYKTGFIDYFYMFPDIKYKNEIQEASNKYIETFKKNKTNKEELIISGLRTLNLIKREIDEAYEREFNEVEERFDCMEIE